MPNVLVMRWVVRVRNMGFWVLVLWTGGREVGLGVGVGVVGPAGMLRRSGIRRAAPSLV